jgi:Glycosyl hydrolase catalytic core
MHFLSTASALVASLLVKDVMAAVYGYRHKHSDIKAVTVYDEQVETIVTTIYVTVDWPSGSTIYPEGYTSTSNDAPATTSTLATTSSSSTISSTTTPAPAAQSIQSPDSAASQSPAPATQEAVAPPAPTSEPAPAPATQAVEVPPAPTPAQEPAPAVPTTMVTVASPAAAVASPNVQEVSVVSSKKRGLAYNSADLTNIFTAPDSHISWAYNWGSYTSGLNPTLEYVAMLWGLGSFTTSWQHDAEAALATGTTHLLCFNEPDLQSQSNIDYVTAASGYLTYMQPFAGKAKLGSPAVTNGNAPAGLTYLSNFIGACTGCTIDFVVIHWYDSATNYAYFKSHVEDAYNAGGGRPVWITEFGASGSLDEQNTFLEIVMPWLDAQPYVERYAYFMCEDGILTSSGNSPSQLGSTFMSYSSNIISSLIA